MKAFLIIFVLVLPLLSKAQNITFGESTTFTLSSGASFATNIEATFLGSFTISDSTATFGSNADFVGALNNSGTIVSAGDLNFRKNANVGSLRFVGSGDQSLDADTTLFVTNMEVNKTGNSNVVVMADSVRVSGNLDVASGVIQTENIDDLIVTGESSDDGDGYVEGKLVGVSSEDPVTFPMGINGFTNYITFTSSKPGLTLIVDCVEPEPGSLLPTEEMVGISDDVEWQVRTISDSTSVTMTVNFSGVDLVNFTNGQAIRADAYAPALVVIQKGDTIYETLVSAEATPENTASSNTEGRIVTSSSIVITTDTTRLNVAWIPIVDDPEFFIPNVFSPDGFYEENRVFRPFFAGGEVDRVFLEVYNSYNDLVYNESDADNVDLSQFGWDGKLRGGQTAEEGVYYYKIVLESSVIPVEEQTRTGTVLLVK